MYTYVVYITQDRTTDICIPWKKTKVNIYLEICNLNGYKIYLGY